jgi:hypothetical protein
MLLPPLLVVAAAILGGPQIPWHVVMMPIAILGLVAVCKPRSYWRRLVLDRAAGETRMRRWLKFRRAGSLGDVAAVQVCPYFSIWTGRVCELSLVMRDPPGRRLPVVGNGQRDDCRQTGRKLAEFLGVPLFDHRGDAGAVPGVTLPDGSPLRVSRYPSRRAQKDMDFPSEKPPSYGPGGLVFGGRRIPLAVGSAVFVLMALMLVPAAYAMITVQESRPPMPLVLLVILAGVTSGVIATLMIKAGLRRRLVDRKAGLFRMPRGVRRWEERRLADMVAVQLRVQGTTPFGTRVWELNLVTREPPGERIHFHVWFADAGAARAAARRLAEFLDLPLLDDAGGDEELSEASLADGSMVRVSTQLAERNLLLLGDRALRPRPDESPLRATRGDLSVIAGGAALALVALAGVRAFWWVEWQEPGPPWFPLVWACLYGACAVGGACLVIAGMRRPTIDRAKRVLRLPRRMWAWDDRPFADVGAVQVCSGKLLWRRREYWQINIVMREPPAERVTFHTRGTAEAARADAQTLADFLGVPLVDHSEPEGTEATIGPEAAGGERDGRA